MLRKFVGMPILAIIFSVFVFMGAAGLSLSPAPQVAPLGHYVLADIYNRQGRAADAAREVAQGRALEAGARRGGR